jgi:Fe-S-cluster-containing dehydrogenase component
MAGASAFTAPEPGSSMLTGPFHCDYCTLACAQRERFSLWPTETVASGTFCQPECAAAYNRYCLQTTVGAQERHDRLEQRYKRRIQCAPTKKQILENKLTRDAWLVICREQLDPEELAIAQQELVTVSAVVTTGIAQRIKK